MSVVLGYLVLAAAAGLVTVWQMGEIRREIRAGREE